MPPVSPTAPGRRAIDFYGLRYRILKLTFVSGAALDFGGSVEMVMGEPAAFYMRVPARIAAAAGDQVQRISDICYDAFYRPAATLSPKYEHHFASSPLFEGTDRRLYLGPMRLHPAEEVWPELTRKGFYGELPQFYT